jgi:glycosyltransferase involved in cell wall biosynthesis
MCTYNGEKYVSEQINSILSQTVPADEIIICDDKSTDNTLNIIKNSNSSIIKLHQNPVNLGYIQNFTQAVNMCNGDIIFFSDQDDVWLPNKIEEMVAAFNADPNAYMIFSDSYITDKNLNILWDSLWNYKHFDYKKFNANTYLTSILAVHGCAMAIRKSALEYTGSFPSFIGHDTWLATVLSLMGRAKPLNKKLNYYRAHENQQSFRYKKKRSFVHLRNKIFGEHIRYFSWQLKLFYESQKRLKMLPDQTPYLLLNDYIQHIETRSNLPSNKLDRWIAIYKEMPRYLKYSAPLTALKDSLNI